MTSISWTSVYTLCAIAGASLFIKIFYKYFRRRPSILIAFFHPYCNSGGGGERVLWVMVKAILSQETFRDLSSSRRIKIIIYNGDVDKLDSSIINNVKKKFGISFSPEELERLAFVNIYSRSLLEAKWYPVATMIFQSLASIIVSMECLFRTWKRGEFVDVYCDTTGAVFPYPFVRFLCMPCKVVAYVHYPSISADMLQRVREQRPGYNNDQRIASSVAISSFKLLYYKLFAYIYGWAGKHAQLVIVNSTWTKGHIEQLWEFDNKRVSYSNRKLQLIYPPCNTKILQSISLSRNVSAPPQNANKEGVDLLSIDLFRSHRVILSVGQFRPEKDHSLQIRAMELFVQADSGGQFGDVILVMLGSTRNSEDLDLVNLLTKEVESRGLSERVFFLLNQSFDILERFLSHSLVGVHTMWNEHFGISVVEMMAAGLAVIAHNSGGPKADIVKENETGFLAETPQEYADKIKYAIANYPNLTSLRQNAQKSASRYSDETFCEKILVEMKEIITY